MRHLLQQSSFSAAAEHLTAVAVAVAATPPPPSSSSGVHTDTFLILAAVLCFLFCVVGLAFVARCWRLCNPSAYSVNAEPEATMPCNSKGLKKKALQALPTVSFEVSDGGGKAGDEECAICLAEFARGDAVRVLPPCGHRFHVACVDVWLVSSSTCPSCRRALVVVMPPMALVTATATSLAPTCCATAAAQASTAERPVSGGRGPCRPSSVP